MIGAVLNRVLRTPMGKYFNDPRQRVTTTELKIDRKTKRRKTSNMKVSTGRISDIVIYSFPKDDSTVNNKQQSPSYAEDHKRGEMFGEIFNSYLHENNGHTRYQDEKNSFHHRLLLCFNLLKIFSFLIIIERQSFLSLKTGVFRIVLGSIQHVGVHL